MKQAVLDRGRGARSALPAVRPQQARQQRADIERLMTSYWAGRSPHTLAAYKSDIEIFCRFLCRACGLDPKLPQIEILRVFFQSSAGRCNELVLNFRQDLQARGKAPTTVNRQLAAIRSLVKLARLIGLSYFSIEVGGVPHELSRDTRGPTPDQVAQLLAVTETQTPRALGLRNRALIHLLFDLGLRVAEVVRLDVADLDSTGGVWVLGKGRTRKIRLTMPQPTLDAVQAWLDERGKRPGPLLLSYSLNHSKDFRLVTRGAYRIVRNLGARIGIHLHPHKLRHSAVTAAVESATKAGLSLDQVRDFSRHKNIQTLLTYRDQLSNQQAAIAGMVASTTAKK